MMNKLTFLGLIPVLMLTISNVYATDGSFYSEKGYVISQSNRPAINPDFSPDESCQFNVFQLKCIPGSQQECPEGFGRNDPATCFPVDENGYMDCPEGYHSIDDDEKGQCYPNSEECPNHGSDYPTMVLLENRPDKDDRCAALYYICSENSEDNDHPACKEYREKINSDD